MLVYVYLEEADYIFRQLYSQLGETTAFILFFYTSLCLTVSVTEMLRLLKRYWIGQTFV